MSSFRAFGRSSGPETRLAWVSAQPVDVLSQAALDTDLGCVAELGGNAAEVHIAIDGVAAGRQIRLELGDDLADRFDQVLVARGFAAADVVDAMRGLRRGVHQLDSGCAILDVTRVAAVVGQGWTGAHAAEVGRRAARRGVGQAA